MTGTSQSTSEKMLQRKRKRVGFNEIVFLMMTYTVGDNPCCDGGVPVACSWDVQERYSTAVDHFERYRPRRRSKRKLILSKSIRRSLLLKSGHGAEELDIAAAAAKHSKMQRVSTLKEIGVWQQLNEGKRPQPKRLFVPKSCKQEVKTPERESCLTV